MAKRIKYFAFGSNLFTHRMEQRVPSARFHSVARIDGYCLSFRKRGVDNTAKADLEPMEGESVWGVIYTMAKNERHMLDRAEGGYDIERVTVATPDGEKRVFTYMANKGAILYALPAEWYLDIILAGAKEHGLPGEYLEALASMPVRSDRAGGA